MKNKIAIINAEGKAIEETPLSWGEAFSPSLSAQAVRVYLSNQRKAQAKTKTRSLVVGSGAKIWRQKGTGHARHGDRQAPIFVGGGVPHGPTGIQNYKKKLSQKMTRKAILTVLLEKLQTKKLFVVEGLNFKKTKEANLSLKKIQESLKIKGKTAVLLAKNERELKRVLANLDQVTTLSVETLHPYFLLNLNSLFLTKTAFEYLEKYFKAPTKDKNEKSS
ncbi:MAG: 50S ribosomal protein L4 [Patescibacteria group bacterium]|nr:50S ribosomal protein L4 [Patescibacteria group bacterium]